MSALIQSAGRHQTQNHPVRLRGPSGAILAANKQRIPLICKRKYAVRLSLKDIIDKGLRDMAVHKGPAELSEATSSAFSLNAFRKHVEVYKVIQAIWKCVESQQPIISRQPQQVHSAAAGMCVYHDHRLRLKANKKFIPFRVSEFVCSSFCGKCFFY